MYGKKKYLCQDNIQLYKKIVLYKNKSTYAKITSTSNKLLYWIHFPKIKTSPWPDYARTRQEGQIRKKESGGGRGDWAATVLLLKCARFRSQNMEGTGEQHHAVTLPCIYGRWGNQIVCVRIEEVKINYDSKSDIKYNVMYVCMSCNLTIYL